MCRFSDGHSGAFVFPLEQHQQAPLSFFTTVEIATASAHLRLSVFGVGAGVWVSVVDRGGYFRVGADWFSACVCCCVFIDV